MTLTPPLVVKKPVRFRIIEDFLTRKECDQLIALGRERLAPSTGFNVQKGQSEMTDWRKSEGCFFGIGEFPLISKIEKEIREITRIPVDHGEGLQLLHYRPGGYYKAHYDYFDPRFEGNRSQIENRGGQRVATFMIYLNDVEEGGETYFPHVNVRVKPERGRALVWKNTIKGICNEATMHSAEPVIKGEKWVVTKWLRENRFQ